MTRLVTAGLDRTSAQPVPPARSRGETAADRAAIAEGRPTSDAAGAMSNWHTLDVAELGRPHLAETVGVNQ